MIEEPIAEIGVAKDGRLYVRPSLTSFEDIYRAALEVVWDPAEGRLVSAIPREWSYGRWFAQVVRAVADEYGIQLYASAETIWENVPEGVRAEIEATQQSS